MDFYSIKERSIRNGIIEVYPDFAVVRSKDLMVRGRSFYAIWDEGEGLWSTDEYDVQRLVDHELTEYAENLKGTTDAIIRVKYLRQYSSQIFLTLSEFKNAVRFVSLSSSIDLAYLAKNGAARLIII